MRSTKTIRAAKTGYIIISSLLMVLGVLIMALPDLSVSVIGILAGAMLVAFGLVKLVGYFSRDLYRLAFQFDLAMGILLAVMGVILLARPHMAMNFICVALGITFLADGLLKVPFSARASRTGTGPCFRVREFFCVFTLTPCRVTLRRARSTRTLPTSVM